MLPVAQHLPDTAASHKVLHAALEELDWEGLGQQMLAEFGLSTTAAGEMSLLCLPSLALVCCCEAY